MFAAIGVIYRIVATISGRYSASYVVFKQSANNGCFATFVVAISVLVIVVAQQSIIVATVCFANAGSVVVLFALNPFPVVEPRNARAASHRINSTPIAASHDHAPSPNAYFAAQSIARPPWQDLNKIEPYQHSILTISKSNGTVIAENTGTARNVNRVGG